MSIELHSFCPYCGKEIAEINRLRAQTSMRGARLQLLHEYMRIADWRNFLYDHPEADGWFDADGVPK